MRKLRSLAALALALTFTFGLAAPALAEESDGTNLPVQEAPFTEVLPQEEPTTEEPTTEEPTAEEPTTEEPTTEEPTTEEASIGKSAPVEKTVDLADFNGSGQYVVKYADVWYTTGASTDLTLLVDAEMNAETHIKLDNVTLTSTTGPAILVKPGASLTLELVGNNVLTGAAGFAGIEVGYSEEYLANLTIIGDGTLTVTGGNGSAGIGGSFKTDVVYGNIAIDGGKINAYGGTGGAGIGSAGNDGGSNGSYKIGANNWGEISIAGGTVNATAGETAAGIGGGSHVDGGKITITDGVVTAIGASGIGSGLGSSKTETNAAGVTKGPGSYHGGEITISGGNVNATSTGNGAGIGGAMYCDSGTITISGGDITAVGGAGSSHAHHGGAGIGGGYEGHGDVTITGGTVDAIGGDAGAGIGSGGTPNLNANRGEKNDPKLARSTSALLERTAVRISGGTVSAEGGLTGGAGIGGGAGADFVEINISDGAEITSAIGGQGSNVLGGAGIGSGCFDGSDKNYHANTETVIHVTGGIITSTGGIGASGIGSGAGNKTAETVAITGGDVTAYADGAKFAVDTQQGAVVRTETTVSVLQGTFLDREDLRGLTATVETGTVNRYGAKPTGDVATLTLPAGYRSFARTVSATGSYLVSERGTNARYFGIPEKGAQYAVNVTLSDNYFLTPVTFETEPPYVPPYEPPYNPGPVTPKPTPTPEPTEPEVEILEPEVPLANLPEPTPAPSPEQSEEMIILEEDVPLGNLPQTGTAQEASPLYTLAALALAASMVLLGVTAKKRKE